MPWNDQNNGPWGKGTGPGGPWQSNGGSNGSKDFDKMVKKGGEKLKDILPMGPKGFLLGAIALLILWIVSGFYTVGPEEQGIVLRFGKHVSTSDPGLNYHLPTPIERVIVFPVTTTRNVEIGFRTSRSGAVNNLDDESLMLTGDENIVDINFVVQWFVSDAAKYVFNVRDPLRNIKDGAESVMREVIGRTNIEFALAEGRDQVRRESQDLLQGILDKYNSGIAISALLLQRADPPPAVIDDYRDVQRARADQERVINEAQAYANRIVPEAKGEASKIRASAEAYKQEVVARADGAAKRFTSVYNEYREAKEVTRRRIYLETMEKVMQNMNKVIIDDSGSGGVIPYLPLPELKKRSNSENNVGREGE